MTLIRFIAALLVATGLLSAASGATLQASELSASHLRCEYLVNPLVVDEQEPRLSWVVASPRRAERQTAYRVLVASSVEQLRRDEGDLWDSGKVVSSQTAHVVYAGVALGSRRACFWKVRAWDRDDQPGPWSAIGRWGTGLTTTADWTAKWIDSKPEPVELKIVEARYETIDGKVQRDVTETVARGIAETGAEFIASNKALGGDPAFGVRKRLVVKYLLGGVSMETEVAEDAPVKLPGGRLPLLRREFTVGTGVKHARLYATALGVYELRLNGQRVGDQCLAPGWTDYAKRVYTQAYDVTSQLSRGKNVLGAMIAPGWFSGRAGLFHAREFYGKAPALLAQLEITYTDGRVERVVSDETWKTRGGPLLLADMMEGEVYDANAEPRGWDGRGYDDRAWASVAVRVEERTLQSDVSEPVRVLGEYRSRALTEPAPGRWTFDLGQNIVGVARLRVENAPRGTVITLRHGEMLNPDGTIYTANLRGAPSTDSYICKGGGMEMWQPRFTFHGFRYVEVTGLPSKPSLETITGIVMGSDLPDVSEFTCTDPRINQLQSNIIWGLRGNYLSVPTDCPQRDERMGWMADAQVFLPTATFNADVAAFMTKWMVDVVDAQRADGAHSDVAPVMKGLTYGTPAWADAGTIVPWVIYQTYGDRRILERHIDSMIRWVEWCRENSTGLIRDKARGNDYGDWLSIKADTPKDLIGTAYFAHSTDLVARSLRVLGREAESKQYQDLFEEIKTAFNQRYVSEDGRMTGGTQCAYVIALKFNLLPEHQRPLALAHLIADIEAKDNHLSTGFIGVSHLLAVLTEGGRPDVAQRLLLQDSFPSWLFSVKHGATTIWERWDGWTPEGGVHKDASMNSFNHYSLGSCGQWLFESIAGIACDPEHPGFEHVIIRPRIQTKDAALTGVRCRYRSIRGDVASGWSLKDGALFLSVTIPANCTATVYVPCTDPDRLSEWGKPLEDAEGVRFLRQEADATVLQIESGSYTFKSRMPGTSP